MVEVGSGLGGEGARRSGTIRGERRIVTVLFADVVNSTGLAESLDPEDWTEIMNGAFEHLTGPVRRYDGTVGRLMGDGMLAFFGAPSGHEDDPQRAVLAGLEIVAATKAYGGALRNRRGLDFEVRVGINTGFVVVADVGLEALSELTAMGDAVNVAARMQSTAAPGTVQIAAETWRLVNQQFETEALGRIELVYRPFHEMLQHLLSTTRARFGHAVLVDCHSMPASIRVGDTGIRPDFIVGDRFGVSAASGLSECAIALLTSMGYTVGHNKPYAGGFITEHYGRPTRGFHALQIEVNRGLYMNERTLEKTHGFDALVEDLRRFCADLMALADSALMPLSIAAE